MSLYKFLPPNPDIVVANRRLRFTRPSGLNDPFELRPYFESIATEKQIADTFWSKFDIASALDSAYDKLPAEQRAVVSKQHFLEFTKNYLDANRGELENTIQGTLDGFFSLLPALTERARREMYSAFETLGILSLSEVATSNHLWMHYGSSHAGLAYEFDENHEFFNRRRSDKDEFFHLRKVDYVDKRAKYESLIDLDGAKIFCVKGAESAGEREWRMLIPLEDAKEAGDISSELIEFPESALTGVVFGMRSDIGFRNKVISHLRSNPAFDHVQTKVALADYRTGALNVEAWP